MVKISFNPKKYEIKITGHAKCGKKGEDIVCAAVSALFYTLAQSVISVPHMFKEPPKVSDESGNGYLSCKPKEEYERNVALIYWTICNGFSLLSEEYKENVKFIAKN